MSSNRRRRKNLHGFVRFGRIQERRLASRDALDFRHLVRDELILRRIGVGRATVLADGEGVDNGRVRRGLDRLEQRREEGRQLASRVILPAHLAEIDRQLVEQDQRRRVAQQGSHRVRAGRLALLVAPPHPLVTGRTGQRVGDLAPRRESQHAAGEGAAVGGIGVLAVESGDPHRCRRQQRRIDELGRVRYLSHPPPGVGQRDQAVRLSTAVGRVETKYRPPRRRRRSNARTRWRADSSVPWSETCSRRIDRAPGSRRSPCR